MSSAPEWLEPYLEDHPLQAGPLLTTVYDLTLSVGWIDTRITTLGEWVVLIGHKRPEDPLRAVLPLPIHTTSLRPSSLKTIFNALSKLDLSDLPPPFPPFAPSMDKLRETISVKSGLQTDTTPATSDTAITPAEETLVAASAPAAAQLDKETVYTAIVTPDSTVVYYKISKGIKKPADVPDE
ncbi:hypothetical protein IAU60_001655 [Kwoniella sp. DSM 27419]